MKPDLAQVLESNRSLRKRLATMPIEENLRMLEALRERTLALRKAAKAMPSGKG